MQNDQTLYPWETHPYYVAFYIESLFVITRSALTSYKESERLFQLQLHQEQEQHLLDLIQNIVLQAAGLSNYLWPVNKQPTHVKRGEWLKECLNVSEDSIFAARGVRNAIQHFDERLDNFLRNSPFGSFLPSTIQLTRDKTGVPHHYFRVYIVDEGVFKVLDDEICIRPVISELYRIHNELYKAHQRGGNFKK